MNWGRLFAMARKETIQIRRDRRSMTLAFVLPMLLILFFGFAITFDVDNIELAVLDRSQSAQSRQVVQAFESSGYFRVVSVLQGYHEVDRVLERGKALAVLVIEPNFASLLSSGRRARVQLLLDGSDANTATIAQSYAEGILARMSVALAVDRRAVVPPVNAASRVWYNETLESVNMIVPGLIAVIMSIIAAMLTALTIAREWERGTMEQLAATPVSRLEVVVGKLLPYLAIGAIDVALAVMAGVLVFDVPFRGNVLLLAAMTLLFLVGALGVGMFISATLKSQVLATQAAMIITYLPALLLSGFLYSIANMPVPLQAFTFIIPARYFITVTRGIFLKGVGIEVLVFQVAAMLIFGVIGIVIATHSFKKQIA